MATVVLSAAGAAAGSAIGGTFLGLSMTAVGRFAGAMAGNALDQQQRVAGSGSRTVEGRRLDRIRLTTSGEGGELPQIWGRMRVAGHVIWASNFKENVQVTRTSTGSSSSGRGKGARSPAKTTTTTTTRNYTYSVNLAVAVADGEISHIARIWADGTELDVARNSVRVYRGTKDQLPDPKIEAVEGAGNVPAYRGTAYVVFEDLDLTPFGNRVPQFTFEVARPVQPDTSGAETEVPYVVNGVAMMPGTGEYALATTKVHYGTGTSARGWSNVSQPTGLSDFSASLEQLTHELPNVGAASLIVSWFGDDLRVGECQLKPKVTDKAVDGNQMPWSVSGESRASAEAVSRDANNRPIYGGTPTDQSVKEAIAALKAKGKAVVFYPFILMEQREGNTLPDPYSDANTQPNLPWRGRITTAKAPGQPGTSDGTAQAKDEVDAFFGNASPSQFVQTGNGVSYTGSAEWSYRRFILHYAHLCAAAGGVEAFCVGSEMRGLTQIRGADHSFPAVEALRQLAQECRAILGPDTKISYAADWSEYFGYHPQDGSGNVYFHLDPLWADPNIDFIGIDNYMPLSDWRDGEDHLDAEWGYVHNEKYLASNVAGGEGYDWYYASQQARDAQRRTAITDGAHHEPWIFRYKDLKGWWTNWHHNRIDGVRDDMPTDWEPQSKPFWFTEYGCAAIDKGTNQPNKFLDPKSSESALPHYSTGARDELLQRQYIKAVNTHWDDPNNNPVSTLYGGPMVDMSHALVWAWDARPFPWFPRTTELWTDGENYSRGHWLNGRASGLSLASLVTELCEQAGLVHFDVSELHGFVRGYMADGITNRRAILQPLLAHYGFDAVERGGTLRFKMRDGHKAHVIDMAETAVVQDLDGRVEQMRAANGEIADRVVLEHIEAESDYDVTTASAQIPSSGTQILSTSQTALSLTPVEGRQAAERWLAEARVARESVRFALPPSRRDIGAGDKVEMDGLTYRVDQVEIADAQILDATRIEPNIYKPQVLEEIAPQAEPFIAAVPVTPFFLDLPLLTGEEVPHAPFVAATAEPWSGGAAVYSAPTDAGFELDLLLSARAVIGQTNTPLFASRPGLIDRGADLEVTFLSGALSSVERIPLLSGANVLAIGDGSPGHWEVIQFEKAELIGDKTFVLRNRLRGQAGTDATMPAVWPTGSWAVLLDGAPQQLPLASSQRGLARYYRIGPATAAVDEPVFETSVQAFSSHGLRPYRPCHLALDQSQSDWTFNWIRRTRIDGDNWEGLDVPIGEETERYLVRVKNGASVVRESTVLKDSFVYGQAERAQDGFGPGWSFEVAQVSNAYGPGPFARLVV